MAKISEEQKSLIKKTLPNGMGSIDIEKFFHVLDITGLDPIMKQIYVVPRKNKLANGTWIEVYAIQTSIDGLRIIAEKTGKYAPGKMCEHIYDEKGTLLYSTATVKKQTLDGSWHEITCQAYFNEYKGVGTFWGKFPHLMLAKCAEALALRKAFPDVMSSLYTPEEMQQADIKPDIKEVKKEVTVSDIEVLKDLMGKIPGEKQELFKKKLNGKELPDVEPEKYNDILRFLENEVKKVG